MASLQIYDTFADPTVENLLRSFFRPERSERATPRSLPIDVAETETGYVVQAELAGVPKDEIHVAIEGNQVTIAAEVKRSGVDENARVLRNERYYGNVYRTFALPVEIDEGLLTEVATSTGGRYFRATDSESLRHIFAEINRLERTTVQQVIYRRFDEALKVPLGLGLLALAIELVLSATIVVWVP